MKASPKYRIYPKNSTSSRLLPAVFVLLVLLLVYNSWATSQDIVFAVECVEFVDSVEEEDEDKDYDLEILQDDDFCHPLAYFVLAQVDEVNVNFSSIPLGFDFRIAPLLPPEV